MLRLNLKAPVPGLNCSIFAAVSRLRISLFNLASEKVSPGGSPSFTIGSQPQKHTHTTNNKIEYFNKDGRPSIGYETYRYDTSGLMTERKITKTGQLFEITVTNSYKKEDAAGNWIEMYTYLNRNLSTIHRRSIKYK